MANQYIIYPEITDAITPVDIAETITVDKWFVQHHNPNMKKTFAAHGLMGVARMSSLLNGLIAAYNLDGNSNDLLGLNNGTDTNISYGTGKIGNGAVFNGASTSKINLGNSTRFNVTFPMSISVWMKTTNTGNQVVIGKNHTTSYYINVSASTNDINFWTANTHTNPGGGITNIADGNWHHIIAIMDSSKFKYLYWDNVLIAQDLVAQGFGTDTNNLYIGNSDEVPGGNFASGTIDLFYLFNKALSTAERNILYNNGDAYKITLNG